MTINVYTTGNRLKTKITDILAEIAADLASEMTVPGSVYTTVARTSTLPTVLLRKRPNGRGREADLMRVNQGITIVPMDPVQGNSTNERDTVGYRFAVVIAYGTTTDQFNDGWGVGTWEQAIRQQVHNRRLSGMTALNDGGSCELFWTVRPGELPDWAKLEAGIDESTLIVTCFVREARL